MSLIHELGLILSGGILVRKGRALYLCMLFCLGFGARALDPSKSVTQYAMTVWQTDQGLPHNYVLALAQTPDGYLWVGTYDGLARFDGLDFSVYNKQNSTAFSGNFVRDLLVGKDGDLYVAMGGAGLLRYRQGRFDAVSSGKGASEIAPWCLAQDSAGTVWIGTRKDGLLRLKGERIERASLANGPEAQQIQNLCASRDGGLWVVSGTLWRMQEGQGRPTLEEGPLRGQGVTAAMETKNGDLWVALAGNGIWRCHAGQAASVAGAEELRGQVIRALCEDRDGNVWIGTTGGLARLSHGKISWLTKEDGLPDKSVYSLLEDREGCLWVGTEAGGLVRLKDGAFTGITTREGLRDDSVMGLVPDGRGGLWVTTLGGLDHVTGGRVDDAGVRDGIPGGRADGVCLATDGGLWLAAARSGLWRVQGRKMECLGGAEGLGGEAVTALLEDSHRRVWVGTSGGGLHVLEGNRFRNLGQSEGLDNPFVHVLLEDAKGRLWVGTSGGLSVFEGARFRTMTTRDGLPRNHVTALYEDAEGSLWIGLYEGGLCRLRGGVLSAFSTKDGLYDDMVGHILEDDGGRLWMSCNRGVFCVPKRDLEALAQKRGGAVQCIRYGKADGMPSEQCSLDRQSTGCKTADGRLWFPTLRGIAVVDPAQLAPARPPQVVIESVLVGHQMVRGLTEITVPPRQKNLEVHYAAPSLTSPEKVRFRYLLEGFDEEWREAGTRRTAYYTNMPPGRYTLRIAACSAGGAWDKHGTTLALIFLPAFYQTRWFLLLCVLSLAGAATTGYRLRVRQLKRRQAELEQLVDERTVELRGANEKLEHLSTHDPLTGIFNRRYYNERLDHEWRRAARADAPLSLIMVDVDFFKQLNDKLGHQEGDEGLKAVARALSEKLNRAGDCVARYGGDEFSAVLADTRPEEAFELAERVRKDILSVAFHHPANPAGVITVTMGVATFWPAKGASVQELIAAADEALLEAKATGRNRVGQR